MINDMNFIIGLGFTQLILLTVEQDMGDYGPIPDKCQPRPEILNHQCCIFPPFFSWDIAASCGARFGRDYFDPKTNVSVLRRMNDLGGGCSYWTCLLKKYYLLNLENLLNEERFFVHLDKWVDLNPPFAETALNAKLHCKQIFRTSMPLDACEFKEFQKCLRNHMRVNCPAVIQTPQCLQQKAFYDECKEYYS